MSSNQSVIPIFDLHADIPWDITHRRRGEDKFAENENYEERSVLEAHHFRKLKEGGICGFNAVIWTESMYKPYRALSRSLQILDSILEDLKRSKNFKLARTSSEFTKIIREGSEKQIALILGAEGAEMIEDDLSHLRTFHKLGLRILGFVWNERNLLADGYYEVYTRNGGSGLSEFGHRVVDECNRLGIILDAAHIAPNGLEDILLSSKDPIIVSHGSTATHEGTLRPLNDEQLRKISSQGGVAGIFAINLNDSMPSLESYLDHVEHAAKIAGIDHVGLGFDFVDYIPEIPAPIGKVGEVRGLKNHKQCQNVIKGLRKRGFSDFEIEKIALGNFVRVLQEVVG
jgi:membrane dipeptidase